jgi:hypothetical protein
MGNSPPRTARAVFLSQPNLIQALVRNVGTCRPDVKGETQMGGPHKGESTDAGHRGGPTRSACLAARVSGGLKSHSARDHESISESGGNASLAEAGERYGEP